MFTYKHNGKCFHISEMSYIYNSKIIIVKLLIKCLFVWPRGILA